MRERLQKVGQKNVFFQKRTGEVIECKGPRSKNEPKTNRNEPKNEAEKLLKTQDWIKNEPKTNRNEPKNEPGQVVENTRETKNEPETDFEFPLHSRRGPLPRRAPGNTGIYHRGEMQDCPVQE
jgi:hypothetical protein